MTGGHGEVHDNRTYASVTGPSSEKCSSESLKKAQLVAALTALVARRQDGVTLREARSSCPLLFDPEMLQNFPSVRHLLSSMSRVVRLEGYGVQTRLYPPSSPELE